MELEEAIKELQERIKILNENLKNYEKIDCKTERYFQLVKEKQVIETVLQALESYKKRYELAIEQNVKDYKNSIPKKKIEDKINRRITKLDAERDDNLDYASDYDFEIQLWEEMKQELLEEK